MTGVTGITSSPRRSPEQALDSADRKARFADYGATPLWKSSADTAAYRAAEERRQAPIIKASGAKPE